MRPFTDTDGLTGCIPSFALLDDRLDEQSVRCTCPASLTYSTEDM